MSDHRDHQIRCWTISSLIVIVGIIVAIALSVYFVMQYFYDRGYEREMIERRIDLLDPKLKLIPAKDLPIAVEEE